MTFLPISIFLPSLCPCLLGLLSMHSPHPNHSTLSALRMGFFLHGDRHSFDVLFSCLSLNSIRRFRVGSGTLQKASRETCGLFYATVSTLFLQSMHPGGQASSWDREPPSPAAAWQPMAPLTNDVHVQASVPQLTAWLCCRGPAWGLLAPAGKLRGGGSRRGRWGWVQLPPTGT